MLIAHSLAGTVVKHSVCLAHAQRSKYRHLNKSIQGLVFLGTPHATANDRRPALHESYDLVLQLGQCKSRDQSDDEIHDLTGICRRFDEVSGDLHIVSIHELVPSKIRGRMRRHPHIVCGTISWQLSVIELILLRS